MILWSMMFWLFQGNKSLWGSHLLYGSSFGSGHWHKYDIYLFVMLYLYLYVLGRLFSMVCIGQCVGSLRMYGGGLGCSKDGGGRECVVSSSGPTRMVWIRSLYSFSRCLVYSVRLHLMLLPSYLTQHYFSSP